LRIVLLIRRLDQGGAQRQLLELSKGLVQLGHNVHIVSFYKGGLLAASPTGAFMHSLGKRGRWDVVNFLNSYVKCIRDIKPDIVYSFMSDANLVSVLIRKLSGKHRVVWGLRSTSTNVQGYDWLRQITPWLEAKLSHSADLIIANSHAGSASAIQAGFPPPKMRIVANGIDTSFYSPDAGTDTLLKTSLGIPHSAQLVGLIARLDPMKDHFTFLHACADFVKSEKNVKFVCVGEGSFDYLNQLKKLAVDLGLDKYVIWLNAASNMPELYRSLDLLCSSSAFGEGFSNAIGEAMACGIPCVVTDVGDSARIVAEFGEVVPPGNSLALSKAMQHTLSKTKKSTDSALKTRQRIVENYSVNKMIIETENIIMTHLK
jgi:glycosyltransferase involved in cell wall biosynthesis